MFSLQKLLGKDDKFFALLEASAEEARHSVKVLTQVLSHPGTVPRLEDFHQAKEADKRITEQINQALVSTFVSQLVVTLVSNVVRLLCAVQNQRRPS